MNYWIVLIFIFWPQLSFAIFIRPNYIPAKRMISNVESQLQKDPKNDKLIYTLGRIHYLVFAHQSTYMPGIKNSPLPYWRPVDYVYYARHQKAVDETLDTLSLSSESKVSKEQRPEFWKKVRKKEEELKQSGWKPNCLNKEALINHAVTAETQFLTAIRLAPTNGLYHLGLASLYEQIFNYTSSNATEQLPKKFKNLNRESLKKYYFKAYSLAIKNDLSEPHKPLGGLRSLVGYEAGQAYLRLSTKESSTHFSEIRKNINALKLLPRGPITPIILSLKQHNHLSDLIEPNVKLAFDLDGDHLKEEGSWIKPHTALLVWDPGQKGNIQSGRQLFGSRSWGLIFQTGYHALKLLDDDGNGYLENAELEGMALWHDYNSNAISDMDEIKPVQHFGIRQINAVSDAIQLGSPMSQHGVVFENGAVIPTYDYIFP